MYLNFLNYFRGFAIFLIVLGHTMLLNKTNIHQESLEILVMYRKALYTSITGGTALFVFISGFLFHHIFYRKGFNFKKFMINKLKNVFLPYTVVVMPAIIIKTVIFFREANNSVELRIEGVKNIILLYLSGTGLISTWYIPFAFTLFLSSSLFVKYIEMKKYKKRIIVIGLAVSTLIHRPIHDLTINVFQAWLYFSPVYCLGIYFSQNKEKLIKDVSDKLFIWGFAWIGMIILQIFTNKYTNQHKSISIISDLDLMIIQKTLMCIFMFGLFYKLQESKDTKINNYMKKGLDIMAKYSFPIFFIHNYILAVIKKVMSIFNLETNFEITIILLGILVSMLSIILAYLVKMIFKEKSRMIIGG